MCLCVTIALTNLHLVVFQYDHLRKQQLLLAYVCAIFLKEECEKGNHRKAERARKK
jgi:hypothetical protein